MEEVNLENLVSAVKRREQVREMYREVFPRYDYLWKGIMREGRAAGGSALKAAEINGYKGFVDTYRRQTECAAQMLRMKYDKRWLK